MARQDHMDLGWVGNFLLILYILFQYRAPYHQSSQTQAHLTRLRIPLMQLSPHSYTLSVCELAFSALKAGIDLN